jgi:hypothetical protein
VRVEDVDSEVLKVAPEAVAWLTDFVLLGSPPTSVLMTLELDEDSCARVTVRRELPGDVDAATGSWLLLVAAVVSEVPITLVVVASDVRDDDDESVVPPSLLIRSVELAAVSLVLVVAEGEVVGRGEPRLEPLEALV